MIIELNVLQDGRCARIFASAEPHEKSWQGVVALKIFHNYGKESIEKYYGKSATYDNDYVVSFKSKLPFKDFCNAFAQSEFNDGAKYSFYKHNCANAANFALKLAGIDLGNPLIKLTHLTPGSFFIIPTPFDLN